MTEKEEYSKRVPSVAPINIGAKANCLVWHDFLLSTPNIDRRVLNQVKMALKKKKLVSKEEYLCHEKKG